MCLQPQDHEGPSSPGKGGKWIPSAEGGCYRSDLSSEGDQGSLGVLDTKVTVPQVRATIPFHTPRVLQVTTEFCMPY